MTEQNEMMAPPPDEKTLVDTINDLPDQEDVVVPIDMAMVTAFCDEVDAATTTKRMVTLPNALQRFEQAFLNIERFQDFTKVYDDLMRIFKNMKSDCEFDYFKAMMPVEEEANDETSA